MSELIRLDGIIKVFGSTVANNSISLSIMENEVLCLLGENGSGKTTLMNILFGIVHQDCGDVVIRGAKVDIASPKDAYDYGIGMVHQHFMLFNQNTVLENIIIGEERTRLFLHPDRQRAQLEDLIERFDFRLDLDEKICNLSVGMKQRVEILKVLYRGMDILIFDEPTAVLTPQESEQMLQIIRQLKQDGKTVVYITHKLNEALEIGDRIAVLRKGKLVDVRNAGDSDAFELARMMVGHDLGANPDKTTDHAGGTVLSISNLNLRAERKGCSLDVCKGEIVGIAGVDGNGQLELEQFIVGLRRSGQGRIYLDGLDIGNLPVRRRKQMGFAHIPSDRHRYAMIPGESLCDNYYLSYYDSPEFKNRAGVEYKRRFSSLAERITAEYDVRTSGIDIPIGHLSGGNQQKAVIARELSTDPHFILAAYPTRGLDIGAIHYIHKLLIERRNAGAAVLLISADLSEILSVCDRLYVLFEGEIVAGGKASEFSQESLGLLIAGYRK